MVRFPFVGQANGCAMRLTNNVGNQGHIEILGNRCHDDFRDGHKADKPQIRLDVSVHF
jgi:hypothetical protein